MDSCDTITSQSLITFYFTVIQASLLNKARQAAKITANYVACMIRSSTVRYIVNIAGFESKKHKSVVVARQ